MYCFNFFFFNRLDSIIKLKGVQIEVLQRFGEAHQQLPTSQGKWLNFLPHVLIRWVLIWLSLESILFNAIHPHYGLGFEKSKKDKYQHKKYIWDLRKYFVLDNTVVFMMFSFIYLFNLRVYWHPLQVLGFIKAVSIFRSSYRLFRVFTLFLFCLSLFFLDD